MEGESECGAFEAGCCVGAAVMRISGFWSIKVFGILDVEVWGNARDDIQTIFLQ